MAKARSNRFPLLGQSTAQLPPGLRQRRGTSRRRGVGPLSALGDARAQQRRQQRGPLGQGGIAGVVAEGAVAVALQVRLDQGRELGSRRLQPLQQLIARPWRATAAGRRPARRPGRAGPAGLRGGLGVAGQQGQRLGRGPAQRLLAGRGQLVHRQPVGRQPSTKWAASPRRSSASTRSRCASSSCWSVRAWRSTARRAAASRRNCSRRRPLGDQPLRQPLAQGPVGSLGAAPQRWGRPAWPAQITHHGGGVRSLPPSGTARV